MIARRRGMFDKLKDGQNTTLGTLFKKYILKAGEQHWPKPFHAMRASFETDLLNDGRVKPHVISQWLGHSIQIALKHYARIKDEDFDAVTGGVKSGTPKTISNAVSLDTTQAKLRLGVAQKAAQYPAEIDGNNSQQQSQVPIKTAPCDFVQEAANGKMTPTGFEPVLQA